MAAPNISFSYDKNKLGLNDFITVSFTSDINLSAFEARATKIGQPYGVGIGTLVGGFSITPANTQRVFEIYDTELVNGDGEYRISLFGQSAEDGSWNDDHYFRPLNSSKLITKDGKVFRCRR